MGRLDCEEKMRGRIVPFSKDKLKAAPSHSINELVGADGETAHDASYNYPPAGMT
jgi:hypothetical protein